MSAFKVAFKAIIRKDNKILAIKRSTKEEVFEKLWDIPGGRMNFGEMPKEALIREIHEETGLEVNILNPFTVLVLQCLRTIYPGRLNFQKNIPNINGFPLKNLRN